VKNLLILIPVFILALLQGVFLPLNLVLLVVLFWAMVRPPREAFIIAFISGLFLDLAKGTPLGSASLMLLVSSLLVVLYSRRFDPAHPLFLSGFVFIISVGTNLILKKPWLTESLVLAVLSLVLRPLIRYYASDWERGEIKLKV
jgi:rod shape-determining protein MreD